MPRRVRQSSLAPQLRTAATPATDWDPVASSRPPEQARGAMSAFRRGWQQGFSGSEVHTESDAGHDTVEPQNGENR